LINTTKSDSFIVRTIWQKFASSRINHNARVESTVVYAKNACQFASNYSRMNKTIKLLRRNHRWSELIRNVKQYVRNDHICRRIKTARDKYHELLNSLSMSNWSWIDIILDFVTKLFDNKDYNAIFMIVNKLNKMHHYISCTTNENETTIKEIIKLFIQHV
jgi:hypothetical protein